VNILLAKTKLGQYYHTNSHLQSHVPICCRLKVPPSHAVSTDWPMVVLNLECSSYDESSIEPPLQPASQSVHPNKSLSQAMMPKRSRK
jgi:hypothetical protein